MKHRIDIVDAINNGNEIRPLTEKERFCMEPERRGTKVAQQLMQKVYENQHYFYCHCVKPPAVMFVRYYERTNHYSVACHTTKGMHDKSCKMFREIKGWVVDDEKATQSAITRQSQTFPTLSLFSAFAKAESSSSISCSSVGTVTSNSSKSGKKPKTKISTLLHYLIKASKQNEYCGEQEGMKTIDALTSLCAIGKRTQFGTSSLDEWIFIGHGAFRKAREALESVDSKGSWPKRSRPHAFIMLVAKTLEIDDSDVNNKTLKLDNTKFYVHTVITEGTGIRSGGPFLVMMSVCQFVENGKFRIHTAFVKPIVYPSVLMPVDSNHERNFARQVIYRIKHSEGWILKKPIDGKAIKGSFVLPDFIIENQHHVRHLIEVMGMLNDQDYVDRKEYIVPLMKEGWPEHTVYELDPTKGSKDVHNYMKSIDNLVS